MTVVNPVTHAQAIPQWTLSDRLRKAREYAGFDQATLADKLGVSRGTVGNYEAGNVTPRQMTLSAWADACQVDARWIMYGPGGPWTRDDAARSPEIAMLRMVGAVLQASRHPEHPGYADACLVNEIAMNREANIARSGLWVVGEPAGGIEHPEVVSWCRLYEPDLVRYTPWDSNPEPTVYGSGSAAKPVIVFPAPTTEPIELRPAS